MANKDLDIIEEAIVTKIYFIRGQKVMIDRDLADLYGVETKRLKEAVKRNIARFPADFMIEMNVNELDNWRSQFASSNAEKKGLRYRPFCFTEQGVTMLSCILNTDRAIGVNIRIIRVFTKMREMLVSQTELFTKLEQIEKSAIQQGGRLKKHEKNIQAIFDTLKELISFENRPRIGFRNKNEPE